MAIAAGHWHNLALKADGTIIGWGKDNYNQTTPPTGKDFVAIGTGGDFSLVLTESAIGTGFIYQGRLIDADYPADDIYDFRFAFYNDMTAGMQQGTTIYRDDVSVSDGYFTVRLDFGMDVIDSNALWLEIGVRPGDINDPNLYTMLSPRQRITPTPYAVHATSSETVQTPLELSGSVAAPNSVLLVENHFLNGSAIRGENSSGGTYGYLGGNTDGIHGWGGLAGVMGQNSSGYGMWATSISGSGVYAEQFNSGNYGCLATGDYGVYGRGMAASSYGVYGIHNSSGNYGYLGTSNNGVYGSSESGIAGYFTSSSGYGLVVESGNVGIGIVSPATKLYIRGSNPLVSIDTTSTYAGVSFKEKGTDKWTMAWDSDSQYIYFHEHGAGTRMVMKGGTGNVGIGTTAPLAKLDVQSNSNLIATNVWNSNSSGVAYGINTLVKGEGGTKNIAGRFLASGATENFAIYADGSENNSYFAGNVGIGTSDPCTSKLAVIGGSVGIGTTSPEGLFHIKAGNNPWGGSGDLIVREEDGCVFMGSFLTIGQTTNPYLPDWPLVVAGKSYISGNLHVDGVLRVMGWNSGSGIDVIVTSEGILQKKSSSRKYKKNIRSLELEGMNIFNLHPVKFEWKTSGQEDIGLIAEEVEEVLKDLVIYDSEGKPEAVKYDRVALYLLGVVKAQQDKIDSLVEESRDQQQKIARLEETVDHNESLMQRLEVIERQMKQHQFSVAKEVQ